MSRNRMEPLLSDDEIEMDSIKEEDVVISTFWDNGRTWKRLPLYRGKAEIKKTTDAVGDIWLFENSKQYGKHVFVDTKMKDMKTLMCDVLGMKKPRSLISVIGGGDNFKMSKRLKETFRCGLKTALTAGAWIITRGTYASLTKDVGEAVNDFTQNPVVTTGIVPLGCVRNRINGHVDIDEKPVSNGFGWGSNYNIKMETNPEESLLDPNHSRFILVDNATEGEIPLRVKLEEMVANIQTDKEKSVPTVLLVVAGGIGTLKTLHAAIQKKIPAVIVKGSGRMADILAYAYMKAKEIESTNQGGNFQKITWRCMEDALKVRVEGEFKSDKIDEHMNWIKECLDKNDLLSVFELDNTSGSREIDVAILQALLKVDKNSVMDQLRLALEWNMMDVAKNDILTDDKSIPADQFNVLMMLAIKLNRTDFVELLMGSGAWLQTFLTEERLVTLYNEIPDICLLRTLLNEVKGKPKESRENLFSLHDVVRLIKELIGDYYRNSPDFVEKEDVTYSFGDINVWKNSDQKRDNADVWDEAQYLFIWSVFMIRQDMAKLFWTKGKNAIAGALVANSLLKAMKKKTKDAKLAIKMQKHIDEWSNLAIGVLTECHSTDETKAHDLLLQEMLSWGNATCMSIAVKADNNEFISKAACSRHYDIIWMGKLTQENNALNLLMCTLFPPLALWLVKYHSHSPDTSEQKTPCEKLRNHMHSVRKRFYDFFTAPVIIFIYNMMSYSVFLGLFAYILLFNFNPKVSGEEIVLIVWVLTLLTEELRQAAMTSSGTLKMKLQSYITNPWNVLDLITIGLFIIGTILRFVPNPDTFEAARLVLALNFITFFIRLSYLFSAHKELGPQLVMIRRMVQDLVYFVLILMFFVVSYAIASHAIMFPNSPFTWNTINQMMRRSYWNIYGELFLDEIEGEDNCTFDEALWMNGIYPRCPSDIGKHAVKILAGVYMLLVNVLLLNLLIAMFSYTVQKIHDDMDKHFYYLRYFLITEYCTRPVLCPPFIVFSHVFLLIRYVKSRCRCERCPGNHIEVDDIRHMFWRKNSLVLWGETMADKFHHNSKTKQNQSTEYKVSYIHDRMQVINNVDEIHEMMNQQTTPMTNRKEMQPSSPEPKMPVQLDNRLTSLEQKIEWIINAMQANNPVPSSSPPAIPN